MKDLVFSDSRIYPGTRHNVTVYIPSKYDGSTPACVYVQLDGLKDGAGHQERQMKFPQALDDLIARKEIPVTIGVFVSPGGIDPNVKGTVGLTNRSFEYDALNDTFARFVVEELLPFVSTAANVKLSSRGNDRAIGGQSTGGIGAFNAAWERPDYFSRVYVCSGSFVAFRGGNEFPTLIRKTEAKPIRAFLTAGDHDFETCAGDWTDLNREMDTALKFSGYDYKFLFLHGGHCIGYADSFPEAMRFLWQGWPAPVVAGPSAPRVQDLLIPDQPWQLVADGYPNVSSPVCDTQGRVLFIDRAKNQIMRLGLDEKIDSFVADAAQADGLAVGPSGKLYTVSTRTGKIMSYDPAGNGALFADGVPGQYALARPAGGLYVAAPPENGEETGTIWFVGPDKKTVVDRGALKNPAGLALRPDQWLLSAADGSTHWVYDFSINPDGTLSDRQRYFWLHVRDADDDAGATSICYDQEGRLYVATRSGIQVSAWDGPTQVILPLPGGGRAAGLSLGGPALDELFAFSDGKIWKRKIKGHALGSFSPWMKMNPGKL